MHIFFHFSAHIAMSHNMKSFPVYYHNVRLSNRLYKKYFSTSHTEIKNLIIRNKKRINGSKNLKEKQQSTILVYFINHVLPSKYFSFQKCSAFFNPILLFHKGDILLGIINLITFKPNIQK